MAGFPRFLIVLGAVVLLSACSLNNRTPRYNVSDDFEILPYKRYSQHQEVDYAHRFRRPAYEAVSRPVRFVLSEEQRDVMTRHGQPDYLRTGFKTTEGEYVDEWLYWDRRTIVQFVQGQLVFEGPITEMDEHRLRYGYPDRALVQQYETGPRREIWDYMGVYQKEGLTLTFSDGALVSKHSF